MRGVVYLGDSEVEVREFPDPHVLKSVRELLDDIVTHRFRIEQAPEAFELFDSGNAVKVVFDWT